MRFFYIIISVCILATACKTTVKTDPVDSPSEGRIRISVEESFKPFIEQELKVFALSFPNASIEVAYKSEIDCFKDLASDSTRMIIVTRGLDKKEQAIYKEQLSYAPTFGILAYNAIAVVVNKKSKDSVFTMAELTAVLSGKNNKQVVMDGSNLTGIVRFLKDSLLDETPFGKNVVSANGSEEVISYIKDNPNAIGFVGRVAGHVDTVDFQGTTSLATAIAVHRHGILRVMKVAAGEAREPIDFRLQGTSLVWPPIHSQTPTSHL